MSGRTRYYVNQTLLDDSSIEESIGRRMKERDPSFFYRSAADQGGIDHFILLRNSSLYDVIIQIDDVMVFILPVCARNLEAAFELFGDVTSVRFG